jgi:hypothetical protein
MPSNDNSTEAPYFKSYPPNNKSEANFHARNLEREEMKYMRWRAKPDPGHMTLD